VGAHHALAYEERPQKYFDSAEDAARHLGVTLADLGANKDSIQRASDLARSTTLASARAF